MKVFKIQNIDGINVKLYNQIPVEVIEEIIKMIITFQGFITPYYKQKFFPEFKKAFIEYFLSF